MELTTKFYIGLGLLVLVFIGFFTFIGYKMAHSDTYQTWKEYDLKYQTCMNQCTTPTPQETQEECEDVCYDEYLKRKG